MKKWYLKDPQTFSIYLERERERERGADQLKESRSNVEGYE
jgi:hypothetical protein